MDPFDYDLHIDEESPDDGPSLVIIPAPTSDEPAQPAVDEAPDARLYIPDPSSWEARVKYDSEKVYCYQKNPGENYFHLILAGEIYLVSGNEKLCLRCALRRGVATQDRLHWQHRVKRVKAPPW